MKTRISAIVGFLCVLGATLSASAGSELPTMSSGTPELYMSFMSGIGIPSSEDATFTDGTQPTVVKDVDYQMKHSWGGSAGIWFPTRDKLAGFDLGVRPIGDWSISITLSSASTPRRSLHPSIFGFL